MILSDLLKLQRIAYVLGTERAVDILLVRKHEQQRVLHLAILDDPRQLGAGLLHALSVI